MKKTKEKPRHAPQGYPAYRPTVSTILVCHCGMRYIKTRNRQNACIKCFLKAQKIA